MVKLDRGYDFGMMDVSYLNEYKSICKHPKEFVFYFGKRLNDWQCVWCHYSPSKR